MPEPIQQVVLLAQGVHPARGHDPEAGQRVDPGKKDDQHQPQPPVGQGVAGHGKDAHRAIEPRAPFEGGQDAQRDATQQTQDQPGHRQLHRGWQALGDEVQHGPVGDVGPTKVQAEDAPQPAGVLHRQGLIEAQGALQGG